MAEHSQNTEAHRSETMTTHQSPGLQLNPRAQATLEALTNEALDPSLVRAQCYFGLAVCGLFIVLFAGFAVFTTIVCAITGGVGGFFVGLSAFIFPGALALLPAFIGYRVLRILRAVPRAQ